MAEIRGMRHHGHMSPFVRIGALLLAMSAASCGAPGQPPSATASGEVAAPLALSSVERGVVVGLRPLAPASASESRQRTMAQLLRVSTGAGPAVPAPAVEVVVRLEQGNRDVAFVRGAGEGFRLGQRVTLTAGDRPELRGS